MKDFDTFRKLPKNVGDLAKIIVATSFVKWPKCNKSPYLVTLPYTCHTNSFSENLHDVT